MKVVLGVDGWRKNRGEDARKGGEEICKRHGRLFGEGCRVVAA